MPSESAKLESTKHAVHVVTEREIPVAWVEWVVAKPALRVPDPNDPEVERFFSLHPGTEQGDRILRVASTPALRLGG